MALFDNVLSLLAVMLVSSSLSPSMELVLNSSMALKDHVFSSWHSTVLLSCTRADEGSLIQQCPE